MYKDTYMIMYMKYIYIYIYIYMYILKIYFKSKRTNDSGPLNSVIYYCSLAY